jgi:hypothetical protein
MQSDQLARLGGLWKERPTMDQKKAQAAEIARDVAEAVANGVPIQRIPPGVSAEVVVMTDKQKGVWV